MRSGNTGEHTESLKVLDKVAIEDPVLVNTVQERLANLNEITKETPKREAESTEPTPSEPGEPAEPGEPNEPAEPVEPTPSEVSGEKEINKDVVLPPEYLRAAVHRGWKEQDAQKYFDDNPDAALNTFQNIYTDINNASKEWALLGKAKLERDAVPNVPAVEVKPEFKGVDVDKLKEEYDLPPETVALLKAQNEQLEAVMRQPEPVQTQPVQQVQTGPNSNVELDIENFFKSVDLNAYSEFYGSLELGQDWTDLKSGQHNNRWRVLEQADLMIVGAQTAGKKIDTLDALERAHMIISEPIREQVIRGQIKDTATKRANSMTIRPSDGTRSTAKVNADPGGSKGPRTREQLKSDVQDKLNSLFNN